MSAAPVDRRLLRLSPALRRAVVGLGVLSVFGAALVVLQAWALASAIDETFRHRAGVSAIATALVLLAIAAGGRAVLAGAQVWLTARASLAVRAQLRGLVLGSVLRLGPSWAQRQPAGRLVSAVGPGLDGLDGYVTRALPAMVSAAVTTPAVLVVIGVADWQCGVILLVLLPLVPLFMVLIGITTKRYMQRQYAVLERLSGRFLDLLRGLTTLRVYGRAQAQQRILERNTEDFGRHTLRTLRVAFLSGLVLDLLGALSVAVVAVDVGLRLDSGHVGFRTALLVLILAPEVFAPLRAMGAQHHASQEGTTAARAALSIIDEQAPVLAPVPSGLPALCAVGLQYPGRHIAALQKVELEFPLGLTALVGESGAGKSSVLALLLGFVSPSSGVVRAPRRDAVAWLPQRPTPSQPTVGDEVRLGDPSASPEQVAEACARCSAPDPSTALGEDGRGVSAGQRRRIALARALLRARAVRARGEVAVVLLDEPSEDLDAATESVVAAVLDELREWCVVVIATHSDTLVALADRVVSLSRGEVVDVVEVVAAEHRPPRKVSTLCAAGTLNAARSVRQPHEVEPGTVGGVQPAPVRLRDLALQAGVRGLLASGAGLAVLATLAGLGLTATSMWLISRAAQHPNVQALSVAVVGVRTFAVGRAVLRYFERVVTHDAALRMLTCLRVNVFGALLPLPPDALGSFGRGDLLRRFVGDVDGVQDGLVRALVPIAGAGAGGVGAVLLASACDARAGAVLLAGIMLAGLVTVVAPRFAGTGDRLVALAGARDRRASALVDSLGELTAYGQAETALGRVRAEDVLLARASRRPAAVSAFATSATGMLNAACLVGVLAAAASAVRAGRLPVVQVGVLAVCVLVAFESISALPAAFVAWTRCRAGLARVAEVLATAPVMTQPSSAVPAPAVDEAELLVSEVRLSRLSGSADFAVAAGQRLALMGPSGCGKTSLLSAALRLLPIESGRIAVGGVDVDQLRSQDVPALIAGSLQGDHVFDASLRDNVRVVRPEASDEELDLIAKRVGLLEFVRSLPGGWSTLAGPDGAALSGGQRQRLLLARALLADPAVLLLDEPTAHLDAETEAAVLDDLLDATAGRTVLMTTHRRAAAARVDRVVTLVS